jgi:hypothetical protein
VNGQGKGRPTVPQTSQKKGSQRPPQTALKKQAQQYSKISKEREKALAPDQKRTHKRLSLTKRTLLISLIGAIMLLFVGWAFWFGLSGLGASSAAGPTSFSQITPTPTIDTSTWKTAQAFNGPATPQDNSGKFIPHLSDKFSVSGRWQLNWNCQGVDGVDKTLYISIYNADGTLYNAGAQVTCLAAKPIIGYAMENDGGTFYLNITASTTWNITIKTPA